MGISPLLDIASGLFGKKTKTETIQPTQAELQQQKLGMDYNSYLQRILSGYNSQETPYDPGQAYTGQLSSSATPAENTTQALLQRFLGSSLTGPLYDQAAGQISDTLIGKYANPATSPYIQSISDLAQRQLSNSIDQSHAQLGARGNYFSSESVANDRRLIGDTLANLQGVIGNFVNNERGRQFDAVPLAQSLDQYKNVTIPGLQMQAGSTIGSLGRILDQANLDRQYNEYKRQQEGKQTGIQNVAQAYNPQSASYRPYDITTQKNNAFGNIVDIINGAFSATGGGGNRGIGSPVPNQPVYGGTGSFSNTAPYSTPNVSGGFDLSSIIKLLPMLLGG